MNSSRTPEIIFLLNNEEHYNILYLINIKFLIVFKKKITLNSQFMLSIIFILPQVYNVFVLYIVRTL